MKRIQNQKLGMYRVVHQLLSNTPASIIALMPQMAESITTLGNNIASITTTAEEQIKDTKGATQDKNILRQEATKKAISIVAKVRSYATNTENLVLLQEVKYTKAGLDKRSTQSIIIALNIIYTKTFENLSELASYGVNATTLSQFSTAINNYANANQNPRKGIIKRKIATTNLKDLFTATDNLFTKKLNIYIGIIQDTEPEFYKNYQNSRKVEKPIRKSLAILCTVLDDNNNPIPGVKVTVKGMTRIFKTKNKGGFYTKSFPKGMHTLTFQKEGYITQSIPIAINKGAKTDIKLVLSKLEHA